MTCPACKSERFIEAYTKVPRVEEGLKVCIDCGCVFTEIREYERARLVGIWEAAKAAKSK